MSKKAEYRKIRQYISLSLISREQQAFLAIAPQSGLRLVATSSPAVGDLDADDLLDYETVRNLGKTS